MYSKKYNTLLFLIVGCLSFAFSTPKNLIVKEWTCEVNDYTSSSFVINDSVAYYNLIKKTGCAGNHKIPILTAAIFTKYTLLCIYDAGQGFCHANYYRQVIYNAEIKKYIYTHITNGVGGCRRMAIPLLQFVLIPKVLDPKLIKFRYLYRGDSYGNELSKKDAKKLLNEEDQKFDIITNTMIEKQN
jgi:hypothetical protein